MAPRVAHALPATRAARAQALPQSRRASIRRARHRTAKGGGHAAARGTRGLLFFGAETGEPVAFEPEATLDEADRDELPDAPLFVLRVADERLLYDASAGAQVARTAGMRVPPGGKVAYLFE